MREDTLIEAIGFIDEKYLAESERKGKIKTKINHRFIGAAAAALIIVSSLPVAVACGSDTAYAVMNSIMPEKAQMLKPVMRSCTDNGIIVEVVSASIEKNRAEAIISVRDTESDRINSRTDLMESYKIKSSFEDAGWCSRLKYDEDTSTAFFDINLERLDGKDIVSKDKVTFSISKISSLNNHAEGVLENIDLKNISPSSAHSSVALKDISGTGGDLKLKESFSSDCLEVLRSDNSFVCPIIDGVNISTGYFDDALHIQACYESRDVSGYLYLYDSNGIVYPYNDYDGYTINFHRESQSGYCVEHVIKIPFEELSGYSLYGEFDSQKQPVEGKWDITFRLDD